MGQLGDNEVDGADDYIGILDEEQPGVTPSAVVQEMTGDDDDGNVASVVCRRTKMVRMSLPTTLRRLGIFSNFELPLVQKERRGFR